MSSNFGGVGHNAIADGGSSSKSMSWHYAQTLAERFAETTLSSIKYVLLKQGVPLDHASDVFIEYFLRLHELVCKCSLPSDEQQHPEYLRSVARLVALEYARKYHRLRGRAQQLYEDAAVDKTVDTASLLDAMNRFRERYEFVRRSRFALPGRLVCRAYAWHFVHHFEERISVNAYRERVNRVLTRRGWKPLSVDQFKKQWQEARSVLSKELMALALEIREILDHERIR